MNSAQWDGGQVVRYDLDGGVERRIKMPALQTSSAVYGRPDQTDLCISSAADFWPSEYASPGCDPEATDVGGQLFRVHPDIQGKLEHRARFD